MLKASKEQMKHIAEILGDTYNHTVLNFEKETDGGYEDYDDRIYIDGDITFAKMDEIVKYIKRSRCNELTMPTLCKKVESDDGVTVFDLTNTPYDEAFDFCMAVSVACEIDYELICKQYNRYRKICVQYK